MNEVTIKNNSDEDIIATEQDNDSLYIKGSLNEPKDTDKIFKVGKLKDSKPYQNEDGSYIEGRFPKKIIVTQNISRGGENTYYPVYLEIGCMFPSRNPESEVAVSGNIFIDGEEKVLIGYDNGSYYGLTIKTKDEMKGATNQEDEQTPF